LHLKVVELAQRKFLDICDKNAFLNYMNKYQVNFDSQIRISSLEYNISYKNRSRFFKKKKFDCAKL